MKHTWLMFALALAVVGCDRGGATLTGPEQIAVPEVPTDTKVWVNEPARLADMRGSVVLVEAWHPT